MPGMLCGADCWHHAVLANRKIDVSTTIRSRISFPHFIPLTLPQKRSFCKGTRVTGDYESTRGWISLQSVGHPYCVGADTCSCTISHLPSWFSKTTVQRKFPISTLPAFVVISSLIVAVAQTKSPWEWMAASSFIVNLALLYPASSAFTPFSYSSQLSYFNGAISKKVCGPLA